jgi:hypothetical protein
MGLPLPPGLGPQGAEVHTDPILAADIGDLAAQRSPWVGGGGVDCGRC